VEPEVQSILCCNVVSGPNGRNETPNCAAMSLNGSLSNASTNVDENRSNFSVHNYRRSSWNLQCLPSLRRFFEANTLQANTLEVAVVSQAGRRWRLRAPRQLSAPTQPKTFTDFFTDTPVFIYRVRRIVKAHPFFYSSLVEIFPSKYPPRGQELTAIKSVPASRLFCRDQTSFTPTFASE
jgi:hypothetical protein